VQTGALGEAAWLRRSRNLLSNNTRCHRLQILDLSLLLSSFLGIIWVFTWIISCDRAYCFRVKLKGKIGYLFLRLFDSFLVKLSFDRVAKCRNSRSYRLFASCVLMLFRGAVSWIDRYLLLVIFYRLQSSVEIFFLLFDKLNDLIKGRILILAIGIWLMICLSVCFSLGWGLHRPWLLSLVYGDVQWHFPTVNVLDEPFDILFSRLMQ